MASSESVSRFSAGLVVALIAVGAAGCKGRIGGPSQTGPSSPNPTPLVTTLDGPTTFTCDPTLAPAMDQLRALTNEQYLNTLSDVISEAASDPDAGPSILASS